LRSRRRERVSIWPKLRGRNPRGASGGPCRTIPSGPLSKGGHVSDFFQTGVATTLHYLAAHDGERFVRELADSSARPVQLVLPCLLDDFRSPAMDTILAQLPGARYLYRTILVLGGAEERDYLDALRRINRSSPGLHDVLWLESPRIRKILAELEELGLVLINSGKGRAVWLGLGLANADDRESAIVAHDCDIKTYDRSLLDRLAYPVAIPQLGYDYAKGYYARVAGRLYGRVSRLFLTPLLRSLIRLVGPHPFLIFMDSFRYPLSGEFAMQSKLARLVRIPGDWGLEVGMLAEMYRLCAPNGVCDVEVLQGPFDHKHQAPGGPSSSTGLKRMAVEIAQTLFRTLAVESVSLDDGTLRTLRVSYTRLAQDYIRRYADDSIMDGLEYDRHVEGSLVDLFTHALGEAIGRFQADPLASAYLPNWNRVISATPTVLDQLREAVDQDAKEAREKLSRRRRKPRQPAA